MTDDQMADAVVDGLRLPRCSQAECAGLYRRQDWDLASISSDFFDPDPEDFGDRAWKCDQCGSITFDSMLPK